VPVVNAEQVKVGDIEVKYDTMGKGDPILLINGFADHLDSWNPKLKQKLAENHTVITFNNRGIGNTTTGDKEFTIKQFALDTKLFLDAINVTNADVLGFSMGGMIAQELALISDKVDKLIIQSSHCGQYLTPLKEKVLEALEAEPSEVRQKIREVIYPEGYNVNLRKSSEVVTAEAIRAQQNAIASWVGTCHELNNINEETLVLVGKNDNLTPPEDSLAMSKKINGSMLIQIEGGHPIEEMYPEKVANTVLFFLK
jgi:pimeloyl-ACP methyl ester carboxylesterase